MARKRNPERDTEKKRPSAKYFRLHPRHEQAVKNWVELHGADETIVYKVGAFLFMTLPLDQRVRATRQFLEWVRADFPSDVLNWPTDSQGRMPHLEAPAAEGDYKHRIAEITQPTTA